MFVTRIIILLFIYPGMMRKSLSKNLTVKKAEANTGFPRKQSGSTTRFCFGDSDSQLGDYAWYYKNALDAGDKYAHRVGAKKPNAWGLYDMHGNIWEWCRDRYEKYSSASATDPKGPSSGFNRVRRGGSWRSYARSCRSANRNGNSPGYRRNSLGFRLSRTVF